MTTRYTPNRAERHEARRMMAAVMTHPVEAQEVVSTMVSAMCLTGLTPTMRPDAEVQGMADWAMNELALFVRDITERFGHLADRLDD